MLAAGASERFGSDKLLHPLTLRGVTLPLAAHSLRPWLEVFHYISVVVRPESHAFCVAIETALGAQAKAIDWVLCAHAAQGMAASLACGVQANRDAAGWLVGLGDMPAVPVAAIEGVHDVLSAGVALVAPVHAGKRGHPVGFSRSYREELLALKGDVGARRLLERDSAMLARIEVGDGGIFADIDVPGDLQALSKVP